MLHVDLQVKLAHTAYDCLLAVIIYKSAERRVFFLKAVECLEKVADLLHKQQILFLARYFCVVSRSTSEHRTSLSFPYAAKPSERLRV